MKYKEQLYNPRTEKEYVLSVIKTHGYEFFMKEVKKLKAHPAIRGIVEGNVFPNNLESLNKKKKLYFSDNLGGELAWLIWSIIKHKDKLNQYLRLKTELEQLILLSKYEESLLILEKIDKEISLSQWSIECKFSLTELMYGTEKNWELLNDLSSKLNKNNLLLFNLQLYSKKAEIKLSFNRYKKGLAYDLSNLDEDLKQYLYFRFGYFFLEEYNRFNYFLITETHTSLIDRYELVINILTEIISKESHPEFETAIRVVKDLNNIINDDRLSRLLEFSEELFVKEEIIDSVRNFIEVYTTGNYEKIVLDFPKIVMQYPNYFELYELYIKSLIEIDKEFEKIEVSIEINDILENLYSLYTFNDNFEFAFENLAKKAVAFSGLSSYRQLLGLISSLKLIKSVDNRNVNQFFFNSNFSNPIMFLLKKIKKDQENSIYSSLPYSINHSISFAKFKDQTYEKIIPDKKIQLYSIRESFLNGNYDKTIEKLDKFQKRDDLKISDYSDSFNIHYFCLLNKKEFNEAIVLLTNQYLENKNLCSKIDLLELLNIVDLNIDDLKGSYEAVIFSHFSNSNSYLQFVALDELFIEINIDYPYQLISQINQDNRQKILYILEKVCNVDVLGNFLIFDSKGEVIKEREKVLMSLLDIMPDKEEEYIDEIAKLKRLEIVKNVIKEVNDGRIYINVNSLDQSQKTNFKNNFERLLSIVEYTANNQLVFLDVNERIDKLFEELGSIEDLKKDAAFLSCKSFVNELINNFLYSEEYGLEGCLSTRIRHGALENVIRSVFERNGLISKKIGDNYVDIEFWMIDGNHLAGDKHIKIQKSFKDFSSKIDNLIKYLLSDIVQVYSIKSTEKESGLFNYYFSDDIHWLIYKDLMSNEKLTYDDFINSIFDILKSHTDIILEKARNYFKENVKNILVGYLEDLTTSINSALGSEIYTKLSTNLNLAITEIQNELEENVSEWFKLSDDTYQNILDFDSIISTSISLTNNNNINFNPQVKCTGDLGVYGYLHFIFIFRILLDNIIKHSKLDPSEIDCSININYDDELSNLNIVVENNISEMVNVKDITKKFSKIKSEWAIKTPSQSVINREGGSGYEKIKRILNYDLKSKNNRFDYEINDGKLKIIIDIPLGSIKY